MGPTLGGAHCGAGRPPSDLLFRPCLFRTAQTAFGSTGGLLALAIASSTSLLLDGIAIGQETGYTAISYAGQLALALAATRQPRAATIVIAGLFAALGALAREYGPLLMLAGFAVLACHQTTRRYLPLFCLTAARFGGIWYVRNWVLTGNPLYPIDVGLGLPSNPIYNGTLKVFRDFYCLQNLTATIWFKTVRHLLISAPLALLVGLPCILVAGRTRVALAIAVAAAFLLWLWSVPYTSGGIGATLRVLTPAWIALSVAAGALAPFLKRPPDGTAWYML